MIPEAKELKLISIYLYICDIYDSELKYLCQRFSNNDEPEFTVALRKNEKSKTLVLPGICAGKTKF